MGVSKVIAETRMENFLAKELKRKFESHPPKFDRIYVSKRPFQVPKLKEQWHSIYGRPLKVPTSLVPPLQPEMDMILCKENTLIAVELKYFRRKGNALNLSFYEGIEQSLALLRWGFDYVALWQLFEESITPQELWFYGGWTWIFLHEKPENGGLNLPIDFTFMLITKENESYDFHPIQPRFINEAHARGIRLDVLPPLYFPNFTIRATHPNPLLICPEVQKLRKMLMEWLKTQKTSA